MNRAPDPPEGPRPDPDRTRISDPDAPTLGAFGGAPGEMPPPRVDNYEVLGLLGAGGMGVVWEAEQRSPRRRVALKVIRGGQFLDEVQVRMFRREADTLARLKHPDIGAIYESGRTEDGHPFFAMELVRGETLTEHLRGTPDGAPASEGIRTRLELFRRIADAVHYAHQRGVIHRDLKPSNILLDRQGRVYVAVRDWHFRKGTTGLAIGRRPGLRPIWRPSRYERRTTESTPGRTSGRWAW